MNNERPTVSHYRQHLDLWRLAVIGQPEFVKANDSARTLAAEL